MKNGLFFLAAFTFVNRTGAAMKTRGSWNPDGEGNQSVLWQWLNTAQSKGRAAGSSWDSETTALLGQGHCSEQRAASNAP